MHPEPVHSIRSVFHSWKRLSIQLFFIAFLAGGFCACGASQLLTRAFYDSEQSQCDAYYDFRPNGMPFNAEHFYDKRDSVAHTLSPNQISLIRAYVIIDRHREDDSLGQLSPANLKLIKQLVDNNFEIAKAGTK